MFRKSKAKPTTQPLFINAQWFVAGGGPNNSNSFNVEQLEGFSRGVMGDIATVELFKTILSESPTYQAMARKKLQRELDEKIADVKRFSEKLLAHSA